MARKKKWIQGAIKKPGSFTAQAKRAGKSVGEFAKEKAGAGGVTGRRARLAMTLRKLGKRRRGRQYRR
jgi:hypothetical protein